MICKIQGCTWVLLLLLMGCRSPVTVYSAENSHQWFLDGKLKFLAATDLTEAISYAESREKPLFLMFYADWCLPCQIMSQEVFVHTNMAELFNQHFINYKLNVDSQAGANMKLLYAVQELPTVLFLDHKGRVLQRRSGGVSYRDLYDLAHQSIQMWSIRQ